MQLLIVGACCAFLLVVALFAVFLMANNNNTSGGGNTSTGSDGTGGGGDYTGTNGGLRPSKFSMFGKTHYYQVPSNAKGTFMFLPGCARAATGFWPYSSQAPECNGFPEDVSHTKQALRNGYAMFVPTPQNSNLCFTSENTEKLAPIIKEYLKLSGLGNKPLYLGGCSAGGGLAVRYHSYLKSNNPGFKFDGLLLECATSMNPTDDGRSVSDFPPTVWVCMERDTSSIQEAKKYADAFKKAGKGVAVVVSPKRRITPEYFSNRMSSVTPAESKQIVDALKVIGLVDGNGNVTADPHDFNKAGTKASGWMAKLKSKLPQKREFALGTVRNSPLYQAMAVAYSQHDHIADYTTAAFKFFESGGKANMDDLLDKYTVANPASLTV